MHFFLSAMDAQGASRHNSNETIEMHEASRQNGNGESLADSVEDFSAVQNLREALKQKDSEMAALALKNSLETQRLITLLSSKDTEFSALMTQKEQEHAAEIESYKKRISDYESEITRLETGERSLDLILSSKTKELQEKTAALDETNAQLEKINEYVQTLQAQINVLVKEQAACKDTASFMVSALPVNETADAAQSEQAMIVDDSVEETTIEHDTQLQEAVIHLKEITTHGEAEYRKMLIANETLTDDLSKQMQINDALTQRIRELENALLQYTPKTAYLGSVPAYHGNGIIQVFRPTFIW